MNHWAMPKSLCLAAGLAVLVGFGSASALAQESKGENFSAKPAAQLFNSDCTGSGCHKGPQGLAKSYGAVGLAGFLREHYTNSRESAAALAAYLTKQPTGAEPKEKEARSPRGTKPTAAAPSLSGPASWFQSSPSEAAKPKPKEKEKPAAHPEPRTSTAARHEEPPGAQRHDLERGNELPTPSARERAKRGHQPEAPATAAVPPAETPTPAAPAASETETPKSAAPAVAAAPAAPAPSPPPAAAIAPAHVPSPSAAVKKQYDIFD